MEQEYSNLLNESTRDQIHNFIKFHHERNTNIVLITSGGTTVPLEERTVRFIDNFSVGTRGSASAEYYLRKNYAVLFLYRKRSLKPFERKLNNINLLDLIKPVQNNDTYTIDNGLINFNFKELLNEYNNVKEKNLLLNIDFINVFDYFSILEYSCTQLNVLQKNAIIYLAAAVSDFYIPKSQMPKHKIQSSVNSEGLLLDLKPVPKLIGKLKKEWCPQAFIVTFKLETDSNILLEKCTKALKTYGHSAVVGNILESRAKNVVVMQASGQLDDIDLEKYKCGVGRSNVEIEELLTDFLVDLHQSFRSN